MARTNEVALLGYDITRPYAPDQALDNMSVPLQSLSDALIHTGHQSTNATGNAEALSNMLGSLLTDAQSLMNELKTIKKKACVIPGFTFDTPVLPVQNGPLINAFLSLSGERIRDKYSQNEYVDKDGHKISVEDPEEFVFGSSAKKLMMVILLYYSLTTRYCSDNPDTAVRIPLIAYGAANGLRLTPEKKDTEEEQEAERRRVAERLKELRKTIQRDLDCIGKLRFTGEQTKNIVKKEAETNTAENDEKTDDDKSNSASPDFTFVDQKFISSGIVKNGTIIVELTSEMARYIAHCPLMQFPPVLFRNDNRKPNAFTIGVKIALHYSNSKNQGSGTNNTLSVKSLLACAPEIPTYDQVTANNQRNWKQKIVLPLENALNENVRIGYLKSWTYRDPSAKTTYPAEMVQFFSWEQYRRLMIDFEIADTYKINTIKKDSIKTKADKNQQNKKQKKKASPKPETEKNAEAKTENQTWAEEGYTVVLPPR